MNSLDKARLSLAGLSVGDAFGELFFRHPGWIAERRLPPGPWPWTDDTQMALSIVAVLAGFGQIEQDALARDFAQRYHDAPHRGYGGGARRLLTHFGRGEDWRTLAPQLFSGGSYGNGAAMRVAPVGLVFHGDPRALVEQARESALPTHSHPLGVEGAVLLARAVGLLVKAGRFERGAFFEELLQVAATPELRARLDLARSAGPGELAGLGNGIEALDSVPTALACFACWPGSLVDAVGNAVLLGGDTDTIAAMTGALSGASLGEAAIPPAWRDALEDEPGGEGRSHLRQLADRLAERTAAASDRA